MKLYTCLVYSLVQHCLLAGLFMFSLIGGGGGGYLPKEIYYMIIFLLTAWFVRTYMIVL